MFINSLEQPKKAMHAIDALNALDLDVKETIAVAQVHALLAIAEAIYESSDHNKIARAIEDGFDSLAVEVSRL